MRLPLHLAAFALSLLLGLGMQPAAEATLIVVETLEEAALRADHVVVAHVLDVQTELVEGHVRTRTRLGLVSHLDDAAFDPVFTVTTPGGRAGEIATRVGAAVPWQVDQPVVLLLQARPDGTWGLRGLTLGHFVVREVAGTWHAVRSTHGVEPVARDADGTLKRFSGTLETSVPLDELEARIRNARARR